MSYVLPAPLLAGGSLLDAQLEQPLGYSLPYPLPDDGLPYLPLCYTPEGYDLYAFKPHHQYDLAQSTQQSQHLLRHYDQFFPLHKQEDARAEAEMARYNMQARLDMEAYLANALRRPSQSEASSHSRRPSIQSEHSAASWSMPMHAAERDARRSRELAPPSMHQFNLATDDYVPEYLGNFEQHNVGSRRSSVNGLTLPAMRVAPNRKPLQHKPGARPILNTTYSDTAVSPTALSPTSPVSQQSWTANEASHAHVHVNPNSLSLTPVISRFPDSVHVRSIISEPAEYNVSETVIVPEDKSFAAIEELEETVAVNQDLGSQSQASSMLTGSPIRLQTQPASSACAEDLGEMPVDCKGSPCGREESYNDDIVSLSDVSEKADSDYEYTPHVVNKPRSRKKRKPVAQIVLDDGPLPKRGRVPQVQKARLMLSSPECEDMIARRKASIDSLASSPGHGDSDSDAPLISKAAATTSTTRPDRRRLHEPHKSFVCDIRGCEKRFRRSEHLKRHIRSLHTGEKPYLCHVCSKTFSRTDNLSQHMRVHSSVLVTSKKEKVAKAQEAVVDARTADKIKGKAVKKVAPRVVVKEDVSVKSSSAKRPKKRVIKASKRRGSDDA